MNEKKMQLNFLLIVTLKKNINHVIFLIWFSLSIKIWIFLGFWYKANSWK